MAGNDKHRNSTIQSLEDAGGFMLSQSGTAISVTGSLLDLDVKNHWGGGGGWGGKFLGPLGSFVDAGARWTDDEGFTLRDGLAVVGSFAAGAAVGTLLAPGVLATGSVIGVSYGVGYAIDNFPDLGPIGEPIKTSETLRTDFADGSFELTSVRQIGKRDGFDYLKTVIKKFDAAGTLVSTINQNIKVDNAQEVLSQFEDAKNIQKCFSGSTQINCPEKKYSEIRSISIGNIVLSFDPSADNGRGALTPKKVTRTFTNITEEWLRLTWIEDGEEKELVTTPGHEFLAAHGGFRQIEQLVLGGTGTLVLADGSEAEVRSERIVYSAATADMFEQAEGYVYPENGNLALKPEWKKGWKTLHHCAKAFLALATKLKMKGLKKWATTLNASHAFVHVTTGSNLKSTDRLMKAAGAQFVGGAYVV